MATRTNSFERGSFWSQTGDRQARISESKGRLGAFSQYRKMENVEKNRWQREQESEQ